MDHADELEEAMQVQPHLVTLLLDYIDAKIGELRANVVCSNDEYVSQAARELRQKIEACSVSDRIESRIDEIRKALAGKWCDADEADELRIELRALERLTKTSTDYIREARSGAMFGYERQPLPQSFASPPLNMAEGLHCESDADVYRTRSSER